VTGNATLAVDTSQEYLRHVAAWLAGRSAYGQPMIAQPILRRRLAEAIVAQRAATALRAAAGTDEAAGGAAVRAAVECARLCADIHAGAGVFDPRPDLVRRLQTGGPQAPEAWPPLGRLRPDLADRAATAIRDGGTARSLIAALDAVSPTTSTTILDDLVVAEALGTALPPGLAARVMTHRLAVRAYAVGPHAAPAVGPILGDLRSGEALMAIAVTEPEAGSDLRGLTAAVRDDPAGPRLDAVKTYVTGGLDADRIVVAASAGGRPVLVLVDAGRPEVDRRELTARAWRGVGFARLTLRGYPVGDGETAAGDGATALLAGLVRERLMLAALQLAYARRWFADVSDDRRADLAWRIPAAQALLEESLARAEGGLPAMVDAAMAKVTACAAALDVATARTASLPAMAAADLVSDRLDAEATARACTFAGGTADINLALIEGLIPSLL
jgi:alkylation response protein AidB-like acyl-CoA dehydrogenase